MSTPPNEITLGGNGYQHPGRYTGPGGQWVPPIISEAITNASSAPPIQPGTGFRYLTTNILSGALQGDWLPITGQSFSRQINSTGTGTGALNLLDDNPVANAANLAAVTPRKSVLWVLQEGAVVWNGIIWDWQHQSATDGTLPLSCSTIESIFAKRIINTTLNFASQDIFDIARALAGYGLGKTPNGLVAGLTFSGAKSGIRDTLTFAGSQRQTVLDALNMLVTTYEIEYSFRPYQDSSGNFFTSFDLAYPYLGSGYPQSGLVYNFPGNLLDYSFLASGSTSANRVLVTAQQTGASGVTLTARATDVTDTSAGYPLTEMQVSASKAQWTSSAQVQAYANGYLPMVTDTQLTPLVTIPGGVYPRISQTVLGSYAQVAFTSALHPAGPQGQPGFSGTGRVTGWTLTPPSAGTAESAQVQIGGMSLTGAAQNIVIAN